MSTQKNNILIKDYTLIDEGFIECCEVAALTMGAEGKLNLIDGGEAVPYFTKDGISSMRAIRFSNKTKNFGALQALQGSALTLQRSGDSTTCTAVMMRDYIKKQDRELFNKKVERGIYIAVEEVYKHLTELAKPATQEDLKRICNVSSNNDAHLTSVIMEAFNYAEEDGIVEIVLKKDSEKTALVKQSGMLLDSWGYSSPYFAKETSKGLIFEEENVAVLIAAVWEYSQLIINQIQLFYEGKPRNTPLIVFLEKSNSAMLEKLLGIRGVGYNLNLVFTNSYDEFGSETILRDIANFTSASVYNPRDPESKIVFGIADKVVSNLESTTLIVYEVPQVFKDTLATLEASEKKDVRRIKRLKTKAGIIEVGAITPSQAKEEFDRAEDAVFSIKTTKTEGWLVGGGAGLVHISGKMNTVLDNVEKQRGYDLVKEVLLSPMLQILKNSNRESSSADYLTPSKEKYGIGYNAYTDEISNLLEDGIIDSKKSLRIAIESAIETSILMFNLGAIVHFPESQSL